MSDNPRSRRKSRSKENQDGYGNQDGKVNGTYKSPPNRPQNNNQQQQHHQHNQQNGYAKHSPRHHYDRTKQHSQPEPLQLQPQQQQPQQLQQKLQPDIIDLTPEQIEHHLFNLWEVTFERSKDPALPAKDRPIIYQDSSKAWGSESKNPVLSNFNFSHELKRAYLAKIGNSLHTHPLDENGISNPTEDDSKRNTVHTSTPSPSPSPLPSAPAQPPTTPTQAGKPVNHDANDNKRNNNDNINTKNNKNKKAKDSGTTLDNKTDRAANTKHTKGKGKEKKEADSSKLEAKLLDIKQEQHSTKQDTQTETKPTTTTSITPKETKEEQEAGKEEEEEDEQEADFNYDFANTEYEEISDPVERNSDEVIIDINDDGEDNGTSSTARKANGKTNKSKNSKKSKKGKGKSGKQSSNHNDGSEKHGKQANGNVSISDVGTSIGNINNNNNYENGSIINLHNTGNEAWSDLLGTLLPPRAKSEYKTSGTGSLQIDNSGNFLFMQESVQTTSPNPNGHTSTLLHGIPREVVRVFANRFSKPNPSNSADFPGVLPVKWSSGEGLMAAGRKFPMEVPFFLKDMLGGTTAKPTSKASCSNLKCQNTAPEDKPFKKCAKCNVAAYCSRECQVEDWAKRHKQLCKSNATAAEEQRKTFATQKFWATSSIRQMIYLHWYARYGKGVVVIMSKDFLPYYEDDPSTRNLYLFYVPMADLVSEDCPIPALKKCQAEFTKSFSHHESDTHSIASAAVDSTGFITAQIDEVKVLQLKLHKRSCKEHDLQKVDAISIDSHNCATLFTFH